MAESESQANPPVKSPPCTLVIFGAGGDLTRRKLVPALYNLAKASLLDEKFAIVGFARSDIPIEEFRGKIGKDLKEFAGSGYDPKIWEWLEERISYVSGDFAKPGDFDKLKSHLLTVDEKFGTAGNYLFYLATPPSAFLEIVQKLQACGLNEQTGQSWRRVIVEKPFGRDLESARTLNQELAKVLQENQIYRIDHYLGKETVQNILVFRFGNGIFEPIWNHRYIDHIQITVAEDLGVEQRATYYEEAGALRDMVSNHLLQLFALTAMEPPISFDADAIRDEKSKVLRSVQPLKPEDVPGRVIRGQYGAGTIQGKPVPAYRSEPRIAPESPVETFVALKLLVDNWRWVGVPFYLRTGKRLAGRTTEIAIQFKRAPIVLFRETQVGKLNPNLLVIQIQPCEGISLQFAAKVPGPQVRLGDVKMDFAYSDYFGATPSTGYETLLYDCINGDATLFQRADNVEAGWAVVNPILEAWKGRPAKIFPNYASGSAGPKEAEELLEKDGRHWRKIE